MCPKHLFGIAQRAAEINYLTHSHRCCEGADLVIRPDLGAMGLFEDEKHDNSYQAGKRAMEEQLPALQDLIEQRDLFWVVPPSSAYLSPVTDTP